jgi:hypothetical protein
MQIQPNQSPMTAPTPAAAPQAQASEAPTELSRRSTEIVDKLITSGALTSGIGKMGGDSELVIDVSDPNTVRIRKTGPGVFEKAASGAQQMIGVAANEVALLAKTDPSFAFKEAALGVKTQVYNGLPKAIQTAADVGFLPLLRVVGLALDVKKFLDTRKKPEATKLDKVVDTGHLVTDVAGLVGAVAMSVPAMGPVATPLTIVGLTGDVGAYAYHILDYAKTRGAAYLAAKKAKEEAQQQPAPQPPPQTVPQPSNPVTLTA